jgi:hypothetical protein
MRNEVPYLLRPPSEYMREALYFTTQPIEEPDNPDDVLLTFEHVGWDHILFSTDYPHWDFDDPKYALKVRLSEDRKRQLYHDNAVKLYGLS